MEESFRANLKKVLVPDDRLIQRSPAYAMNVGPQNIKVNYTPANATSNNNVQWTVLPPSYNTRTDRFACVQGFINYYFDVNLAAVGGDVGTNADIWSFGSDGGVSAFPLHLECLDNNKCNMNDEDFTINSADVNLSILRTMNAKKLYYERSTPSSLDRVVNYTTASATTGGMNVLGGYLDSSADRVNNGAYPVFFTDANGNILTEDTAIGAANGNATAYNYNAALNQITPNAAITNTNNATFRVFCKIPVDEPAILNPFVFDEIYMKEASLFEIKSYTVDYNMKNTLRLIKQCVTTNSNVANLGGLKILAQGLNSIATAGPFEKFNFVNYWLQLPAQIVKSPSQCVVPYMEFPRSIATNNATINAGATGQMISNVIEPMGVPDLLIISVIPQSYANAGVGLKYTESNWMCAIQSISISWGEKANLLSELSAYELYKISCKNGLNMTWLEWSGQAQVTQAGPSSVIGTVGGPLYLRPGVDIGIDGLVSGQNIRQQFQLTVNYKNQSTWNINPKLVVVYPVSTFAIFENGSAVKINYPIKSADLFTAEEVVPSMHLNRKVGAGALHRMNNQLVKHHNFKHHDRASGSHSGGSSHSGGDAGGRKVSHRKRSKSASRRAYK